MVLFALTLLLLTLMVCMTLSIGMKAREKMELQTVADAAAYSQAVATARTFNGVSLLNRAFMGHMVVMTGVESLISWSGFYRAALEGGRRAYNDAKKPYELIIASNCPCAPTNATCARFCQCGNKAIQDIDKARDDLSKEDQQVESKWSGADPRAGHEARALQLGSISKAQKDAYDALKSALAGATIADKIAKQANKGSMFGEEIVASTGAASVNTFEIEGDESCAKEGAFCTRRKADHKNHFVYAAMGSRGYAFVTGREGGANPIKNKLQTIVPAMDIINTVEDEGSGYFNSNKNHSAKPAENGAAWGDDHGSVTLTFGRGQSPCPPMSRGESGGIDAHVKSTDEPSHNDEHYWTGGSADDNGRKEDHTMGDCTLCPGMWPPHADYNFKHVAEEDENFGQPKNYAIIQRDYQSRMGSSADPWNLFFNFRFSSTNEKFDNRGITLTNGTDISKATALSAGIAYYHHRTGQWTEPPNFLNPFWRATLISAWVDKKGKEDVGKALGASGAPFTQQAYEALKSAEYAGW